eukprot:TRINITY_DN4270_c0_g1_i1.p1 TRINITY_DN4270_c0_g1~~TRINITY_DN4270_c0_g1_i1.p1  ORF type:complete len:1099 (+),score=296.93 TRINITY_DN4270_c0_g1_i1:71-3367(+)
MARPLPSLVCAAVALSAEGHAASVTLTKAAPPSATATPRAQQPSATPTVLPPGGPTATPTTTQMLQVESCAPHDCGGSPLSYWNAVGAQGTCYGECSNETCCSDGGSSPFSPDWVHFEWCSTDGLGEVQVLTFDECTSGCFGAPGCYAYRWTPGDGLAGQCSHALAGPLVRCGPPLLECEQCRYHSKALLPWFEVFGYSQDGTAGCVGTSSAAQPSSPWIIPDNVRFNVTPADCQRHCEAMQTECGGAEWKLLEPPAHVINPLTGEVITFASECTLWDSVTCGANGTVPRKGCTGNGTCFYQRIGAADYCDVSIGDYFLSWGPMLCIIFLGCLCMVSTVLGCASMRKGGTAVREHARTCCKLFLSGLVPLSLLFAFAIFPDVRSNMLTRCPARVQPQWGANSLLPDVQINESDVHAKTGTVEVHVFHSDNHSDECPSTNELRKDRFWEFAGSCWGPADWGQTFAHLPDPGTTIWNVSFAPGMPRLGEYDFTLYCQRTAALHPSAQRVVGPGLNVSEGERPKAVFLVQFKSKDGTCTGPTWQVAFLQTDCMHGLHLQNIDGEDVVITLQASCSHCEWLRWEHVKNAPYQMMIINSLCSLFFSGVAALIVDNLIPFLGDLISRVPGIGATFKKNCECCTSGQDEGDDAVQFVPCAPSEELRSKIERGKRQQLRKLLGRWPRGEDEENLAQISCSRVGCPGCCDLATDWQENAADDDDGDDDDPASPRPRRTTSTTEPIFIGTEATARDGDMEVDTDLSSTESSPLRQQRMEAAGDRRPSAPATVVMTSSSADRTSDVNRSGREAEAQQLSDLSDKLQPSRKGCCVCRQFVVYWFRNGRTYLYDNWDHIHDALSERLSSFQSAADFASAESAPCFFFVFVKSVFLWVAFVVTVQEVHGEVHLTTFDQYQMLYVRLVNSGIPLLLLESARGVLAAWAALHATGSGGKDSASEKRKAVRSIGLTILTVSFFVPPAVTHIVPMIFAFPWLILILYVLGWQFFMQFPGYVLNDVFAKDWKTLVDKSPWKAFIIAELLGFWGKFSTSFFVVLPLQMLYNFGVLMYSDVPYWDIPGREYRSRKWECLVDSQKAQSLAATLQVVSFYF